jgi:hypothetical protein
MRDNPSVKFHEKVEGSLASASPLALFLAFPERLDYFSFRRLSGIEEKHKEFTIPSVGKMKFRILVSEPVCLFLLSR